MLTFELPRLSSNFLGLCTIPTEVSEMKKIGELLVSWVMFVHGDGGLTENYPWLSVTVNLARFWTTSGYFGPFWGILGHFGVFWATLGYFGPLWGILGHFGVFWATLGYFGPLWGILGHFGVFWATLGYFGPLRGILGHFGVFWATRWGILGHNPINNNNNDDKNIQQQGCVHIP